MLRKRVVGRELSDASVSPYGETPTMSLVYAHCDAMRSHAPCAFHRKMKRLHHKRSGITHAVRITFRQERITQKSRAQRHGFFAGGGDENRTRVRKPILQTFYECSLSFTFPQPARTSTLQALVSGNSSVSHRSRRRTFTAKRRPDRCRSTHRQDGLLLGSSQF